MRHMSRPAWCLIVGAIALAVVAAPRVAALGRPLAGTHQGTETATAEVPATETGTSTGEPNPTDTATTAPLPTDTAIPLVPTATPGPIYLPWVDRLAEAAKQAPVDQVAGNILRLALGPRQFYVIEDGPPRLTVFTTNTATRRLDRGGSMALDAPGLDPRTVRLAADDTTDFAYLLYYNALTAVEAVNPPQPRKLLAAPDCDALETGGWAGFLGCDGLRIVDLENPGSAAELFYLARPGRTQALGYDDGLLAAAYREPVPASRPTTLALYHTGYRQQPRDAGHLADIGNTVDLRMIGRHVYQLVDEDGRRGLQVIDVSGASPEGPYIVERLPMDGIPRRLAFDSATWRLFVLEEGWFDRRDRRQHGQTGVRVYSLKDPRQPRLWRFLPLDQPAADIAAADGLLYVAGGTAGLAVYRVE